MTDANLTTRARAVLAGLSVAQRAAMALHPDEVAGGRYIGGDEKAFGCRRRTYEVLRKLKLIEHEGFTDDGWWGTKTGLGREVARLLATEVDGAR